MASKNIERFNARLQKSQQFQQKKVESTQNTAIETSVEKNEEPIITTTTNSRVLQFSCK